MACSGERLVYIVWELARLSAELTMPGVQSQGLSFTGCRQSLFLIAWGKDICLNSNAISNPVTGSEDVRSRSDYITRIGIPKLSSALPAVIYGLEEQEMAETYISSGVMMSPRELSGVVVMQRLARLSSGIPQLTK